MNNLRNVIVLLVGVALRSALAQCPQSNGLFAVHQFCDRYVECRNNTWKEQQCPDGLYFNAQKNHFRYPCDYPADVDCTGRPQIQAPQPSPHCPNRYGMFPDDAPLNCGVFWNCVEGKGFQQNCPEGLAFSTVTSRCDYPDEAPNCDAEAFLGFRCPPVDPMVFQLFLGNPRFAHAQDCKKFFVCVDGRKPRLQGCGSKQVFNQNLGACDDPINVPGCENYYGPPNGISTADTRF